MTKSEIIAKTPTSRMFKGIHALVARLYPENSADWCLGVAIQIHCVRAWGGSLEFLSSVYYVSQQWPAYEIPKDLDKNEVDLIKGSTIEKNVKLYEEIANERKTDIPTT